MLLRLLTGNPENYIAKAVTSVTYMGLFPEFGGHDWDRTSDPCDVNTVLYR